MTAVKVLRALLAVVYVVLGWSVMVGAATTAVLLADAAAAEPVHPIARLAHTRITCKVIGVDQAGEVARFRAVDLSARALRCVLDGMGAPAHLWPEVARTYLTCAQCRTEWADGTVSAAWFRHPDPGRELDLTIRVTPPPVVDDGVRW